MDSCMLSTDGHSCFCSVVMGTALPSLWTMSTVSDGCTHTLVTRSSIPESGEVSEKGSPFPGLVGEAKSWAPGTTCKASAVLTAVVMVAVVMVGVAVVWSCAPDRDREK